MITICELSEEAEIWEDFPVIESPWAVQVMRGVGFVEIGHAIVRVTPATTVMLVPIVILMLLELCGVVMVLITAAIFGGVRSVIEKGDLH